MLALCTATLAATLDIRLHPDVRVSHVYVPEWLADFAES
jgi:hypothetical protein